MAKKTKAVSKGMCPIHPVHKLSKEGECPHCLLNDVLSFKEKTLYWNVWVECDGSKKNYSEGREILENRCGECSGSGGGWDISWHGIETEAEAKAIAKQAARFGFVDSVRYYQDSVDSSVESADIYVKGKA